VRSSAGDLIVWCPLRAAVLKHALSRNLAGTAKKKRFRGSWAHDPADDSSSPGGRRRNQEARARAQEGHHQESVGADRPADNNMD
jgi:hypothetical protein